MNASYGKVAALWDDILQAVHNKKNNPHRFHQVLIEAKPKRLSVRRQGTSEVKLSRYKEESGYHLGAPFSGIYFTQREAQCMVLLMAGYTNNVIARFLHLSPRTIEFYVKNMRQKTGCMSKSHLIKSVVKTTFLETVDFSVQDIIA